MKRIIIICCIALIISCKSKSPGNSTVKTPAKVEDKNISIVKPEEVDMVKKDRAYDIGSRLLKCCNTSRFKAFTSTEATDKVRHNATREKVSAICKKINQRNGSFINISLIEVTRNKKLKEYTFHYNIAYEKKLYKRDLYVTVNDFNQVSAISTKEVPSKPL